MPSLIHFLAYLAAAIALTLVSIPRSSCARPPLSGRKALHAALGIDLGCFIWGAVVAFGKGAAGGF